MCWNNQVGKVQHVIQTRNNNDYRIVIFLASLG